MVMVISAIKDFIQLWTKPLKSGRPVLSYTLLGKSALIEEGSSIQDLSLLARVWSSYKNTGGPILHYIESPLM